jgi:hypothetical protein
MPAVPAAVEIMSVIPVGRKVVGALMVITVAPCIPWGTEQSKTAADKAPELVTVALEHIPIR